jgi:drug/metabolite transporter (DMT)-like permease
LKPDATTTLETTAAGAVARAAGWMAGALLSFTAMAFAGREISHELNTFQLMTYRGALALILIVVIAAAVPGGLRRFRTRRPFLHILRNLSHFVGQFGWFYGVALIPLAQVFALEFTTPIWVALLAPLLLGERLTLARLGAAAMGFVGVMIVLRPGTGLFNTGSAAVLIAAVGFAGSLLATKRLSATEHPMAVLFYMALVQTPLALGPTIHDLPLPSPVGWLWLLLVALCSLSAHFCITRAFSLADAVVVAPMDFLRLPLIALLGMAVYGEALELWVFVGGAIILLGNWGNLLAESRRS